jgi:putative DNA primase/helicase
MTDEKTNNARAKSTIGRHPRSPDRAGATTDDPQVEVYARAGTPGLDNWCLLLNATAGGHQVKLRLPSALVRHDWKVVGFLESHGVDLPTDPCKIVRSIQRAQPEHFVRLVHRPGWHGEQFLLGADTLGKCSENLGLDERADAHVARVKIQGSLDDWKREIADCCTTSSYLVFGLAVGFSVPLLQLTRVESELTSVESGGFHFWVRSTRGKTTLQRCVASIFGKGTKDGGRYVRSWKTTMAAAEDTARGHCDLPLILDEMKLLAANPRKAAQLATDTAYSIANETEKARSSLFAGSSPPDAREFRTLILSSGEISLGRQASEGHTDRLEGEAVRLIDIPVPRQPTGIFDRLPRSATANDSRPLAEGLEQAAATYYGKAGKVYIKKLGRDLINKHDDLICRLRHSMDEFLTKSGMDSNDGYEVKFAKRFALAYAAALLAIEYGVVSWDPKIVYRSIRRVYRRARSQTTRPVDPVQVGASTVIQKVRELPFVDIRRGSPPVDTQIAENANVLLFTHSSGSSLYALRRDFFKSIVGPRISAKKVAKYLDDSGILIPRSETCRTLQVSIPGLMARRGYYCLTEPVVTGRTRPETRNGSLPNGQLSRG